MADGNTIAEQIADINASKAAIAAAIAAKGVEVPEGAKLAELAEKVGQISGGGPDTCTIDRDTATALVIPEGVTQIGNYAFYNLNAGTLNIPEGVTRIGAQAFYTDDAVLTRLTLPSTLKTIEDYAFRGRYWRGDIDIPEGVTAIGYGAFRSSSYNFPFLYIIRLPGTLQSIGNNAFANFGVAPDDYVPCFANGTKEAFKALFSAGQPYSENVGLAVFCTDGTFLFRGTDTFEDDDDRVYGEDTSEKDGNAITFDIQGFGFVWDDAQSDEGFFWVAHLGEPGTKVQAVETLEPGRHLVVTVADMGSSGNPPGQLSFARRTDAGVLETAWTSGYVYH